MLEKEEVAKRLRQIGDNTHHQLERLKPLLIRFLEDGYWRDFDCIGDRWTFSTFGEFCEKWLQLTFDQLMRLYDGDTEVEQAIAVATGKEYKQGGNNNPHGAAGKPDHKLINSDNVTVDSPERGNSKSYRLRRLARAADPDHKTYDPKAAELFDAYGQGNISANAAAIAMGWTKVPTGYEQLVRAWGKASEEERNQFMADYG